MGKSRRGRKRGLELHHNTVKEREIVEYLSPRQYLGVQKILESKYLRKKGAGRPSTYRLAGVRVKADEPMSKREGGGVKKKVKNARWTRSG